MIPAGAEGSDDDDAVLAAGWIRACRRAGSQGAWAPLRGHETALAEPL